ncbi:FAD dependent oxidoreductase [Colletotrichum fioriniae PJ7]|uniref:6-methylsalicylate decarboxylase n=1 Tax=Colletotrichum fioriniae PJ7 TaxID=1445577 RepID=A0A010RLT4_9PEZI|nr:FAD dependent oxidoreductase [Colletotrichum fioriniae PJ7]
MATSTGSYLIIGAGVFGASTALHLIRAYPDASITLVDRNAYDAPIRVAASWDWNKVVRADYVDIEYMRLCLEAKKYWSEDPIWKPYYHESGVYWVSPNNFAEQMQENYKKLGVDSGLFSFSVDEAKKQYGGIFKDADFTNVKEVFVNKNSGWGEAKEALQRTIEEAMKLGVKYIEAEVGKIEFDQDGAATGVKTSKGESITASRVVLSTGAYTAKLLADSAPERKDLQAGDRFVAAAVTEGFTPVSGENATDLYNGPVGISMVPPSRGASNGSVPHSKDKTLKFWGQIIFRNTQTHANGSQISAPPPAVDYAQLEVPEALKEDVDYAGKSLFGKESDNFKNENYRICWEAVTPDEDFIISPHSASKNLYVATCGSFHGWKFLPILASMSLLPILIIGQLLSFALAGTRMDSAKTKIDVHAHYVPDFYAQALRDAGHLPGPDGMPGIPEWTPEAHINFMEAQDIEKSYLSISSPGVYLSVPSKPVTEKAIKLARQVNEYAAEVKAKYPEKFGFFASLPLPDVSASVEEIKYCFTQLDPKPDGIVLMSNFYGMYLGDPDLDPVYKALNEANATIFEHPTAPCTEHNHLRFSIDGEDPGITPPEWLTLNRPVAGRQGRAPTIDFPFDTARTFADLFYSKIPTRFPRIKWIMPHAGGGLVPTLDRIVSYSTPDINLTESFMKFTLAENFYFDLAGPWPVTWAIPPLLRWVSYEKLLWGTDTPFTPWAMAEAGRIKFDQHVEEALNDTSKVEAVRRGNAAKLFG